MSTNFQTNQLAVPVTAEDHVIGHEDAPVTLMEYADFQCPYCGAAESTVRTLRQELSDRLRFVFRNFPLTQVHPYAMQAAAAAEAAGLQGAFWEMHDLLFENQQALDEDSLLIYAEELGLDIRKFVADMQSERILGRIQRDIEGGIQSGVEGTPTFFINGQKHEGSWDYESLLSAILAAV